MAAQNYRDQLVARKEFRPGARIVKLTLRPCDAQRGDWFWSVLFHIEQAGQPIEHLEIAVAMDGKVIPLQVSRRIDVGWPLPDQLIPPHNSTLSDEQIVSEFIANLNVDRRFAGQEVTLTGRIESIPHGHEHLSTNLYLHFVTSDGEKLIFTKSGRPGPFDREVTISGKLAGFRDTGNRSESWDGVHLYPGIRCNGMH